MCLDDFPVVGDCIVAPKPYNHRTMKQTGSHALYNPDIPRHSMYAIYAYIGVVLVVNVGISIYGIHGVSG